MAQDDVQQWMQRKQAQISSDLTFLKMVGTGASSYTFI
jgi:hypothetical protein